MVFEVKIRGEGGGGGGRGCGRFEGDLILGITQKLSLPKRNNRLH